ncbi:hypothetical protein JF546_13965 [Nitratireductor aquimarinus]|nr:hypothetical protein [Nitratireductor aquimarinus]MBN8244122.1 hypothetical protein [Nitratireductor aquimarinus]MBY6131656.1 hypothetical protein [Nitratireductor aquimarinus]
MGNRRQLSHRIIAARRVREGDLQNRRSVLADGQDGTTARDDRGEPGRQHRTGQNYGSNPVCAVVKIEPTTGIYCVRVITKATRVTPEKRIVIEQSRIILTNSRCAIVERGEQLTPLQRAKLQCRGRQQIDYGAGITDIAIGGVEAAAAALGGSGHHGQCAIGTGCDVDAVGLKSGSEREFGDFHIADQESGHLESGIENGDGGAIGLHENQIVPVEPDIVDRDTLRKADNIVCISRQLSWKGRSGHLCIRLPIRLGRCRIHWNRLLGILGQ